MAFFPGVESAVGSGAMVFVVGSSCVLRGISTSGNALWFGAGVHGGVLIVANEN